MIFWEKASCGHVLDSQLAGWGSAPSWLDFEPRWFSAKPENSKETESKALGLVDKTIVQGAFTEDRRLLLLHLGHTCDQRPLCCFQMQTQSNSAPHGDSALLAIHVHAVEWGYRGQTIVKGNCLARTFLSPESPSF